MAKQTEKPSQPHTPKREYVPDSPKRIPFTKDPQPEKGRGNSEEKGAGRPPTKK